MFKTFALAAVLSLAAFGCKKKAGNDCDSAVNHAVDTAMAEEMKGGGDMPPEMKKQAEEMMKAVVPKIKSATISSCKADKWSDDVIKCFNDAKTKADFDGCENKLTPQQKANVEKAQAEAMGMGGSMGGGTPPPPPPPSGSDTMGGSADMGGSAMAPAGGSADMAGSAAAGSGMAGSAAGSAK